MGAITWDDLTPKEREAYVNQDCVPQYKLIPRQVYEDTVIENWWGAVDLEDSTRLKIAILGLHEDGKDTEEIAYHVPCSLRYIQMVLENFRKNEFIKDKIIEMYKQGHPKSYIRFKLQCNRQYVYEVINKFVGSTK